MRRMALPLVLGVLVALAAVAAIFGGDALRAYREAVADPNAAAALPFRTELSILREPSTRSDGLENVVWTSRRATYRAHGCGITDIGDLRLVVPGMVFDGESLDGPFELSTTRPPEERRGTGSGRTGRGERSFAWTSTRGVTECSWAGIEFRLRDGGLEIDGRRFEFGEGPRALEIDREGAFLGMLPR